MIRRDEFAHRAAKWVRPGHVWTELPGHVPGAKQGRVQHPVGAAAVESGGAAGPGNAPFPGRFDESPTPTRCVGEWGRGPGTTRAFGGRESMTVQMDALAMRAGVSTDSHQRSGVCCVRVDPTESFARPRVAAGVLFFDTADRVMLVVPSYRDHRDIPGGYVEHGETPRQAAQRQVREELGIDPPLGRLLVVDWAPTPKEGDKQLVVFDGGLLERKHLDEIVLDPGELTGYEFHATDRIHEHTIVRLARRITHATRARAEGATRCLEDGAPAGRPPAEVSRPPRNGPGPTSDDASSGWGAVRVRGRRAVRRRGPAGRSAPGWCSRVW